MGCDGHTAPNPTTTYSPSPRHLLLHSENIAANRRTHHGYWSLSRRDFASLEGSRLERQARLNVTYVSHGGFAALQLSHDSQSPRKKVDAVLDVLPS